MNQDLQAQENDWTQLFLYLLIGTVVLKQLTITFQMEEEEEEEEDYDMSKGRTVVIMISGLAIGIIAAVFAGQWIFDAVFDVLHPDTSDFWQNLVTLAIAAFLTLIAGGLAFGIVVGIFYGIVYGFSSKSRKMGRATKYD
jgi:MFS family permease